MAQSFVCAFLSGALQVAVFVSPARQDTGWEGFTVLHYVLTLSVDDLMKTLLPEREHNIFSQLPVKPSVSGPTLLLTLSVSPHVPF